MRTHIALAVAATTAAAIKQWDCNDNNWEMSKAGWVCSRVKGITYCINPRLEYTTESPESIEQAIKFEEEICGNKVPLFPTYDKNKCEKYEDYLKDNDDPFWEPPTKLAD